MKSLTDQIRITPSCPHRLLVFMTVMGLLSPGHAFHGPDLGLENSQQPLHWKNNSTPSTLYCRTGHTLQILPNGTVKGTMEASDQKYANFTFTTAKKRTVAIRQVDTGFYLCMHNTSVVYANKKFSERDCEWVEVMLHNWYNAYQHKHHRRRRDRSRNVKRKRFFLAFNPDGTMSRGDSSRKTRKNTQFLRGGNSLTPRSPVIPRSYPVVPVTPAVTNKPTVAPTTRRRPLKLGCKGLKTKYCQRMRRMRKKGKRLRHAKRHRRCQPRRLSYNIKTISDGRKLRRLERRCERIRRKRRERRRQKRLRLASDANRRTSSLTHVTTRIPHRT